MDLLEQVPTREADALQSELESVFFMLKSLRNQILSLKKGGLRNQRTDFLSIHREYNICLRSTLHHLRCRTQLVVYLFESENFLYFWNYLFDQIWSSDRQFFLNVALLFLITKHLKTFSVENS